MPEKYSFTFRAYIVKCVYFLYSGGSVWLVPVPSKAVEVRFDGELKEYWDNQYHCVTHENYTSVMAVPYDLFVDRKSVV